MAEPAVFTHANMRDLSASALHMMISQRQSQRLLTAIAVDKKRKEKNAKLSAKSSEQHEKLGNRIVTRLAKIGVVLAQCEADLRKMQSLNNNIALFDTDIGDDDSDASTFDETTPTEDDLP